MDHNGSEALGYLCRWTLLGVLAVFALAVGWTGLLGAHAVMVANGVQMTMSDAAYAEGRRQEMVLAGQANTGVTGMNALLLAHPVEQDQQYLGVANQRNCFVILPPAPAGVYPVRVIGIPYGPVAYQHDVRFLHVIPRSQPVYILDADLPFTRAEAPLFETRLNAEVLHWFRKGRVIVLYSGPYDLFRQRKASLLSAAGGAPVICLPETGRPTGWSPMVVAQDINRRIRWTDTQGRKHSKWSRVTYVSRHPHRLAAVRRLGMPVEEMLVPGLRPASATATAPAAQEAPSTWRTPNR